MQWPSQRSNDGSMDGNVYGGCACDRAFEKRSVNICMGLAELLGFSFQ